MVPRNPLTLRYFCVPDRGGGDACRRPGNRLGRELACLQRKSRAAWPPHRPLYSTVFSMPEVAKPLVRSRRGQLATTLAYDERARTA